MTGTVNGINLSSYGLKVLSVDGELSMPRFKAILEQHDYQENLRVFEEKVVRLKLFGKYSTASALGIAISNFKESLKTPIKQRWVIPSHGFDKYCVAKLGAKARQHGMKAVEIDIALYVTRE